MGRVPRVAARGFGPNPPTALGVAVQAMHDAGGGTVRQVPDGFQFTPAPPPPAPTQRMTSDGTVVGKPITEAGVTACRTGQADWCQGCDTCRHRGDMRWLADLWLCRACLGPGVGTTAVWADPWADAVDAATAPYPWTWDQLRAAGYVVLTAVLALVFLASMLGAFG